MNKREIPTSAGLLVFRYNERGQREYLVVHPSGPYHRNSPYYIPKGKIEENETAEEAAIRETLEETGIKAEIIADLGSIIYKSKTKRVLAFLAKFVDGKVIENGIVDCDDWENDIKRFVPKEVAYKLLREEFLDFVKQAETYFKNIEN